MITLMANAIGQTVSGSTVLSLPASRPRESPESRTASSATEALLALLVERFAHFSSRVNAEKGINAGIGITGPTGRISDTISLARLRRGALDYLPQHAL